MENIEVRVSTKVIKEVTQGEGKALSKENLVVGFKGKIKDGGIRIEKISIF